MAKINVLDQSVYNKISAGEVVEKPCSVVKELIENSIDAKSTDISIRISNGGITFIEVADNGMGIEKDQLTKVFMPHATSKIKEAKDLERILSLGFRGEAMASIASVSMVTLESSTTDGEAYKIQCEGGELSEITQTTRGKGTTVAVRNLFYNTPARLKFLRKEKAEERDIINIVEKIAFANPFIRFELKTENGLIFKTKGEDLLDAIQSIYGKEITANLLEINAEQYGMKMTGYISNTSFSKPTRNYQTFIVNGRVINNISLVTALNNVYVDYFVKRTYPFCIVSIKVPTDEIDVNVHPSKTEVKFEYQSKVYSFIQRNVKRCLEDSLHEKSIVFGEMSGVIADEWITPFNKEEKVEKVTITESESFDDEFAVNQTNLSKIQSAKKNYEQDKEDAYKASLSKGDGITIKLNEDLFESKREISDNSSFEESTLSYADRVCPNFVSDKKPICEENSVVEKENKPFQTKQERISLQEVPLNGYDYRIVGQIFRTYIVLEFNEYLMLIDQHAAAEYKLYTKFLKMIESGRLEIQPLLLPIPLELSRDTVGEIEDKIELLASVGIEIQRKDELHYEIVAIPALLQEIDSKELIANLFSNVAEDLPLKERLMYKACRSAIKGNTALDNEAIDLFIKGMFQDGMFPKCPHGRPSFVKITKSEIEKIFQRIV